MMLNLALWILLLAASPLASADIGRLFFTPDQRATLDNARKKNQQVEVGDGPTVEVPKQRNVTVNGLVQRSDGRDTVWINSRPVTGRQSEGLNVTTGKGDARVRISLPEASRGVDLKVGQSAEMMSGTIADVYARTPANAAVKAPTIAEPVPATTPKTPPLDPAPNVDTRRVPGK